MSSLELALQRLLAEAHPRKERDLVEAAQGALERLNAAKLASASVPKKSVDTTAQQSLDEARAPSTSEPVPLKASSSIEFDSLDAEEYWVVFKLACAPSISSKVKVLALDALHKLIAHGKLTGNSPLTLPPTTRTTPVPSSAVNRPKFAVFSEVNDLSHIDCSDPTDHLVPNLPGANTVGPDHYPSPPRLMDEIVHTVCMTYRGPGSADDNVQLQIIKILLTLVTTTTCEVHHASLLKIIQTSCNIFCWAKSPILQATAKAGLTQMVNLVISKMETDAHALRDIEKTLRRHSIVLQPATLEAQDDTLRQPAKIETDIEEAQVEVEVEVAEVEVEVETTAQAPAEDQDDKENQDSQEIPHDHDSNDTPASTSPSDIPLPASPILERSSSSVSAVPTVALPIPAPAQSQEQTPHEIAIAKCRVSRQDAYLTFRLLCKLSLRAEIISNSQQEELSVRGRALVLELILSMMNNSGPVFQSDELFVSAVRQYLCVSLSQNGVSANETLFEFSLSLFLTLLRYYRAQLKAEIEVLFNEFYLKFLDMSNATLRQKEMVLQGLHKICSNPQSLVDIYLNFDCDFTMASIFEHIVNSLSRIAQGRGKVNASATVGNMMGKQLLLNEKDAWALIQDRRLAVQGLRCMVSVLDSLVDWSKDVGTVSTLPEAITSAVNTVTNSHSAEASADFGSTNASPMSPQQDVNHNNDNGSGSPISPRSSHSANQYNKMSHPVIVSKNPLLAMSMRTQQSASSNMSSTSVNTVGSVDSLGDDHPAEFEENMTRKRLFLKGVSLFNAKPMKGIDFFIKQGFVQDDLQALAAYLMTTPGLDKAAIGEYIGEGDKKAIKVMHAFVDRLDFTGVGFVDALRMFLQNFRLPGESQKIDRIMEKFADRYCDTNPKVFANAEPAYILAFSVIMLNTDQHSDNVKRRMDVKDFIKNNRGINDNANLPDEYLTEIFNNISNNEIVLEDEQAREASKATASTVSNNKQRQELYDMAISQMQKNARALLAGNDGRVKSTAAWRNATHAEHVKPMFAVACWPAMATLSLAFEEAIDPSIFANKTEPKTREFSAINAEAIELCLRGITNAIRIASIFHMEVERDAFISSLAKLTGMNHVSEMQPKNVLAIRTLLKVANTMGEYLEGNWNLVLKTISAMEQLQLIPQGGRVSTEGFNGVDYQHTGSGASPGSVPQTPQASSRRKVALSAMMNEFQSQDTIIAIDKIFVNSTSLSGDAVVHLFKSICAVSLEEVEGSRGAPRMYMLQRIIEIADYNMVRIRFEWTQIWRILQSYFNAVGCSSNANVSTFAIDSLRQLAMKFLARDELAHFNTQNELLRPFEHIYKNNPSVAIHDLIIQSLRQMIAARASNIRSGWKPMFGVFGRTATHGNGALVENAFGIVEMIYENSFEVIETSFVDYVNCLVEFCFNYDENVVNGAMTLLRKCARGLWLEAKAAVGTKDDTPHPEKQLILEEGKAKETEAAVVEEDEDTFFLKWFPIVYGLSRVVIDSDLHTVRSKALVSLFEILNGSGEIFESQYWSKIYRVVLMPIFEDLKDPDYKRRDSTTTIWIQALRLMINLYSRQYHQVFYAQTDFLKGLLELITLLVSKKSEHLGQMGIICLSQLVTKNGSMFDEERWELITGTLETIFEMTTPHEVMVLDTASSAPTQPTDGSPATETTGTAVATPAAKFDFQETVTKCAIHLVAITFVKDMALVDLSLWPSSSSPFTGHHVSVSPNPSQSGPQGDKESTSGSRSSSFSVPPGSDHAGALQGPAIKPRYLHNMPTGLRHRWLECLRKSYRFVRAFNDNYELRHYLYKSGQIQQLPNMFKQENLALTTYVSVLFDFYRQFGDGEGYDAEDEIQAVLEPLVQESKLIIARYLGMLSEPNRYPKDVIVNQSQLTIMVLRELQRTPVWWPNAAMTSTVPGSASPQSSSSSISNRTSPVMSPSPTGHQAQHTNGNSQQPHIHHPSSLESDKRKYQGLRKELPDYFRLTIRLIGVERQDVRVALQEFMGRVGELLVLE
ncbi:Brefeldin A-inhibited guanine nucleotide-exchange protein 2 [Linnemannia schmuckeri]|uniref:Brefeldin A-inhibited guanine nucleotide-exchange protein 2 n=1 Tax=Linnemannia schmuckeri TaxID=64567 RepID=A0A9P5RYZ8_9FUNG|nr:Brefeldin A-inhibited guanine nucleotide-exchange protein 2 [Linnemannia schmuckeri]